MDRDRVEPGREPAEPGTPPREALALRPPGNRAPDAWSAGDVSQLIELPLAIASPFIEIAPPLSAATLSLTSLASWSVITFTVVADRFTEKASSKTPLVVVFTVFIFRTSFCEASYSQYPALSVVSAVDNVYCVRVLVTVGVNAEEGGTVSFAAYMSMISFMFF